MADDLELSGGGVIGVSSSELYAHADIHGQLAATSAELLVALAAVDRMVRTTALILHDAPMSAARAEDAIAAASAYLRDAHAISERLPGVLRAVALRYELADRLGDVVVDRIADDAWWLVGVLARTLNPLLLLGGGAAVAGLFWLATGGKPGEWLEKHPEAYTSWAPLLTGGLAEHADEAVMGLLGLPVWLAPLLGGTSGMARGLTNAHPAGTLRESTVRIKQAIELEAPTPPTGAADGFERMQTKEHGGAQVVVERYVMPDGTAVANVFIDGTEDWSPWSSAEPWDMTSNFGGMAQNDYVGAVEGVKAAMRAAGVTADTPVQLFGYSQGGIHAALVAHQAEFNVVTLNTVGAPIGDIPLPPELQGIAIAHEEDLVFALGDDFSDSPILLVKTARFADEPLPEVAAPGHQFDPYRRTFRLADADSAPELQAQIGRFVDMTAGAVSSSSTAYVIERVPTAAKEPAASARD